MFVELFHVPRHLGDPAVQAGLIRGLGKLGVDHRYVLALGHHQPGQIFGKMPALRGVGEHPAELVHGVLDYGGKNDNTGMDHLAHHLGDAEGGEALPPGGNPCYRKPGLICREYHFCKSPVNNS